MLFKDKVQDPAQTVVIYEMIPPPIGSAPAEVAEGIRQLRPLLAEAKVDAINLPEIRDESRGGPRKSRFIPRLEPRIYAQRIQQEFPEYQIEAIVNRCVVYAPWWMQQQWLLKTWKDYKIKNLVLVGGESSQVRYPGLSVTEAGDIIANYLNHGLLRGKDGAYMPLEDATQFCCGGITIPTRRKADPAWDEPQRLIQKARNGLSFFTTQVIYEAESTKKLLRDYHRLCTAQGARPCRILLSFAPVSNERDFAFLKWLEVEIPADVERDIVQSPEGMTQRSMEIAAEILTSILDYVSANRIEVPLGLNIEYILKRNFEVSLEMVDQLSSILKSRAKRTAALLKVVGHS